MPALNPEPSVSVIEPSVPPCIFPIYEGLRPAMLIHISGKPLQTARRFSVNLQAGRHPVPSPNIALRIDVNFITRRVSRNSRYNGVWGQEEAYLGNFPFVPHEDFSIVITIMHDRFHIVINRQHMIQFAHRLRDVRGIDTLYIDNDAVICSIRVVEGE